MLTRLEQAEQDRINATHEFGHRCGDLRGSDVARLAAARTEGIDALRERIDRWAVTLGRVEEADRAAEWARNRLFDAYGDERERIAEGRGDEDPTYGPDWELWDEAGMLVELQARSLVVDDHLTDPQRVLARQVVPFPEGLQTFRLPDRAACQAYLRALRNRQKSMRVRGGDEVLERLLLAQVVTIEPGAEDCYYGADTGLSMWLSLLDRPELLARVSEVFVRKHLLGEAERALFDVLTKTAGVRFDPIDDASPA
jgi:hypothetical protein